MRTINQFVSLWDDVLCNNKRHGRIRMSDVDGDEGSTFCVVVVVVVGVVSVIAFDSTVVGSIENGDTCNILDRMVSTILLPCHNKIHIHILENTRYNCIVQNVISW